MEGDLGLLTVRLLLQQLLDVDAPSATVHLRDLALKTLAGASDNLHGVAMADGDAAGQPLGRELLAQLGRHELAADGRGGREVGLAQLSALAGHAGVRLNLLDYS